MKKSVFQSCSRVTAIGAAFLGCTLAYSQTLETGHLDIGIAYESGEWNLHLHDEENGLEIEPPNTATIRANANARTTVPSDPNYSFLGSPGSSIWVLPKTENPDVIFLGFGTEELTASDWSGNIEFTLKGVTGPGNFFAWDVDTFGNPSVLMNSRDGITSGDRISLIPESHGHYNLGFSEPGEYSIFFQASGVHTIDGPTLSGDVEYRFSVVPEPSASMIGAAAIGVFALLRRNRGQHRAP